MDMRKADTRRKIQLGGLVIKAGLANESPAIILGALIAAAKTLAGPGGDAARDRLRQIGEAPSRRAWLMHRIVAAVLLLTLSAGLARAASGDRLTAAHAPRQAAVAEAILALRPWTAQSVRPEGPVTVLLKPLGALADAADAIASDNQSPAENITAGPLFTDGMRADFRRQGWPAPTSLASGFQWLQAQLAQATPQTQRAMITTALRAAEGLNAQYGPWLWRAPRVSDQLGQRTVKFSTHSTTPQKGGLPNVTTVENFTGRPLMSPDEVMATGATLVCLTGERPYALRALNYLADPEYRGLAEDNPRYRKAG